MNTPIPQLEQMNCTYSLRRSGRARRLRISLEGNHIEVVAPHRMALNDISKFIEIKRCWIEEHLEQIQAQQNTHGFGLPRHYAENTLFPLGGKMVTLHSHPTGRGIDGDSSALHLHGIHATDADVRDTLIRSRLTTWLKTQARQQAEAFTAELAPLCGRAPTSLRITSGKGRWGSCNSKGCININWRLMLAPEAVFRYVVAHEMAHLEHMNHSADFWRAVAEMDPNFKQHKKWLKDFGHAIQNPQHPERL